mmetsp:Transcript_16255/g.49197  ORF Transcript_16255/g.49197 Transcript_16255/m.49197 type:complete len:392 (-) Transcript_16255:331-1506(-)
MVRRRGVLLLLVAACVGSVRSFLAATRAPHVLLRRRSSSGGGNFYEHEEECRLDRYERRQQHAVLNNFLTQRAVQTLIFLQKTSRDTVTAGWLERFGQDGGGFERYHGTRGLKSQWDDYLSAMLTAELETIVVSLKKRGPNGTGGWSKNNPYLQARYFNYTVDIRPANLAERVLELRTALAAEWKDDLRDISNVLQENHFSSRRAEVVNGSAFSKAQEKLRFAPLEGYDAAIGAGDSTPYRRGNFDLLARLSAQEGVFLVLKKLQRRNSRESLYSRAFLEEFYEARSAHFDGDGPYGVAETFLRDLADQLPRVISSPYEKPFFLDPVRLAESVMYEQRQVLQAWHAALDRVPHDNSRAHLLAADLLQSGSSGGFSPDDGAGPPHVPGGFYN